MFAIITCSLITALLVGGLGMQHSISLLEQEATERVLSLSDNYANEVSSIFENIEGTITALSANVRTSFDLNAYKANPKKYLAAYKAQLAPTIAEMTKKTGKINGIYFTFNPDLTKGADEIWYLKDGDQVRSMDAAANGVYLQVFRKPVADYMLYYYMPIEAGHGTWTEPALDPDSKVNVISYSEAVYVDGVLIGVAGCDIGTENTIDIIQSMKVYQSGYAFLMNEKYDFMIHPKYSKKENLKSVDGGIYKKAAKAMSREDDGVVKYKDEKGHLQIIGFSHLTNGWIIAVMPPWEEVFAPAKNLALAIFLLTLLAIGLSIIISRIFSDRFAKPIHGAVDELKYLGLEDFSHEIPVALLNRGDELGEVVKYAAVIKEMVEKKTAENREKDLLLLEQSRLAKMGEMVGNIAHQWKQPLNSINLIVANLLEAYRFQELDEKLLEASASKTLRLTERMSDTIEDFLNFIKPNKEKTWFSAVDCVDLALELMEESIRCNRIHILIDRETDFEVYGYPNEFSHAVYNLINNARDAVLEEEHGRIIEITISKTPDAPAGILKIKNYGNGIEPEILGSIFTPYFTTKDPRQGTGVGLSISKTIIEQRMDGKLEIKNLDDGVCCIITINNVRDKAAMQS